MYVSYVGSLVRSIGNVPKDPGSNQLTSTNHYFTFCNWQYDALEGNRSQFFLQHKTTSADVGLPVPSTFTNAPCGITLPPAPLSVKSTCSVDIYQLVLRNLRPPLSTSALRKLPPFLPASG